MQIYEYGQKEIEFLKKKDKKLGEAIESIGMIERKINPDPFAALISSIIGQQISTKAASTIRDRLNILLVEITPETIEQISIEQIQGCGMTLKKAGYIKGIADAALNGIINFDKLNALSDEEIIKQLSALGGVGVWTVEMLLIHSLCRPDILSYGDLGIRRGMMNLYGLKELPKKKFEVYRKRYSPYGTVASIYLWALSAQ